MKKVIVLVAAISTFLWGQDSFVGERFEKGSINYADRTINAVGIGFIPENVINAGQARRAALRIAKQDALRQLIEIVNGVTVNSETTMRGAMLDDVIRSSVQGMIRGAYQVGEPRYLSDTSIEVEYQVKMSGISEIITPATGFAPAPVPGATALTPSPATAPAVSATSAISGLIIDARGLKLRPAMSPRLLDQNGDVVYGPGNYTREYAVTNGVTGYSKSLEAAQKDPRVQGNPLVIKALSAAGTNMADVVVGNSDVPRIQNANSSYGILKDCRVLILLD